MPGYVALPRPGDTVKWIIVPLGFLVGCASRGWPGADALSTAVVVWLTLELLVYQARYQWNDIRGFDADQQHRGGDKGRLPGPPESRRSRIAWSAATAVVKVVLAIALCWAIGPDTGRTMLALTLGVFGVAFVYETLRSTGTGRTGEVPSPATPGVVSIWVVIGAGYALRAVTGLGLAVDVTAPGLLLPVAVLTCWLFGTAWITSRWAVEATAFASLEGGRLRWHATAAHAREHQLALVRWLPPEVPSSVQQLEHWCAVQGRTRWSAPWNLTGVAAAGGAAVSGALLTDENAGAGVLLLCFATGAAAAAALVAAGSQRALATVVLVPVVVAALTVVGAGHPVRAAAGWLVVVVAQACYLRQDRASMGQFLRRSS